MLGGSKGGAADPSRGEAPHVRGAGVVGKRVVIVLAGPAMNPCFPVALYVNVRLPRGHRVLPPTVGPCFRASPRTGSSTQATPSPRSEASPSRRSRGAEGVPANARARRCTSRSSGTAQDGRRDGDAERLRRGGGAVGARALRARRARRHSPTFAAPVIGIPRTDRLRGARAPHVRPHHGRERAQGRDASST